MNLLTRLLAGLGVAPLAAACSPSAPSAELSSRPKESALENSEPDVKQTPADLNNEPTTTTDAPTTTVLVTPAQEDAPAIPEFVMPENVGAEQTDVEWIVRSTFPEDPDEAASIAWCESRFRPDAGFPSGPNLGVMQIAWPVHAARVARMGYTHDDLANPIVNLAVARALYDESGWRPWSCAA